jgi:hypothetical protein
MNRILQSSAAFLAMAIGLANSVNAEIIDRIVAVIDSARIITFSDVRKERAIRAALGEETVSDDAILTSLIEWRLKETQMAEVLGIEPSDEEVSRVTAGLKGPHSISPAELRNAVSMRLRWANFRDQRFGRVRVPTNDELRDYYLNVFVEEARRKSLNPIPSFEQIMESAEARAQLQRNVVIEEMDRQVGLWMETLYRRSDIEVFR